MCGWTVDYKYSNKLQIIILLKICNCKARSILEKQIFLSCLFSSVGYLHHSKQQLNHLSFILQYKQKNSELLRGNIVLSRIKICNWFNQKEKLLQHFSIQCILCFMQIIHKFSLKCKIQTNHRIVINPTLIFRWRHSCNTNIFESYSWG